MSKEYKLPENIKPQDLVRGIINASYWYWNTIDKVQHTEAIEYLNNLQAIENVEPSEALNKLGELKYNVQDEIRYYYNGYVCCKEEVHKYDEDFKIIEQALLKAQEPKHYLKWEDLEFSKEYDTFFKVKLGDSIYTITCSIQKFNNNTKYVAVETGLITYFIEELNKQFFNDLHLERVEE